MDYIYAKQYLDDTELEANNHLRSSNFSEIKYYNETSMRALVIIFGQLRGGPLAWESLLRFVLDFYRADLAIVGTPSNESTSLPIRERALYTWKINSSDVGSVLDDAANGNSTWRVLCRPDVQFLGGIPKCLNGSGGGSGGILLALRYVAYRQIVSLKLNLIYDWFIFTRSDFLYLCSPPPLQTYAPNAIYVPHGQKWGGYNDKHAVLPSSLVLPFLNLTADLVNDWAFYINAIQNNSFGRLKNFETLQRIYFEKVNITVVHQGHVAFTVRRPIDPSNWSPGYSRPKVSRYGLLTKYPLEILEAERSCDVWVHLENWAFKYLNG